MVVESTNEIQKSTDRFIESEMIISRGFMVSAQMMFGEGYKAIIRNLSHRYGKSIIEYLAAGTDLSTLPDIEKLQLLFERGVSADDVQVTIEDDKLILTTLNCKHHLGKDVREKTGIPQTRVCPVGILATCLIQNILSQNVTGGHKDADNYEKTRECNIHFDLTGERS